MLQKLFVDGPKAERTPAEQAPGAWPAGSLGPGSIGNSNHETTFMTTLETLNMSVFKKRNLEQTASGLVVLGSFLKHETTQTRNEAIDYYKPSETNLKFTDSKIEELHNNHFCV